MIRTLLFFLFFVLSLSYALRLQKANTFNTSFATIISLCGLCFFLTIYSSIKAYHLFFRAKKIKTVDLKKTDEHANPLPLIPTSK